MKQRLAFLIISVVMVGLQVRGQGGDEAIVRAGNCSSAMKFLSYWWKKDSLANNGGRFFSYDLLAKSKIDSVSKDMMLMYLGNPNRVDEEYYGTIYEYNVFDIRTMPKGFEAPGSCISLHFIFSKGKDI